MATTTFEVVINRSFRTNRHRTSHRTLHQTYRIGRIAALADLGLGFVLHRVRQTYCFAALADLGLGFVLHRARQTYCFAVVVRQTYCFAVVVRQTYCFAVVVRQTYCFAVTAVVLGAVTHLVAETFDIADLLEPHFAYYPRSAVPVMLEAYYQYFVQIAAIFVFQADCLFAHFAAYRGFALGYCQGKGQKQHPKDGPAAAAQKRGPAQFPAAYGGPVEELAQERAYPAAYPAAAYRDFAPQNP